MTKRRDGLEKRERLLDAASAIFASKGFHNTTIAEICESAQANVASVNYYFGDKDTLYIEVLKHAHREALRMNPIDGGVAADAPVDARLRGYIASSLRRIVDNGRQGYWHNLHMKELANPTGHLQPTLDRLRQPARDYLRGLLLEFLGPDANEEELLFCELSITGQCRSVKQNRYRPSEFVAGRRITPEFLKKLADHILDFSLAGLQQINKKRARAAR